MSNLKYEEIIHGLINGNLTSPQVYEESFYINLRITGTGITERYKENKDGEIIYKNNEPVKYRIERPESEFLSEKFLNACVGIPVLIEHPDKKLLDGENYKEHIVGTIIKAFIKPELKEVWCVARIYDPEVLKLISEKLQSTSPAVISSNEIGKDGIIKERFEYIDHLALVVDGYWDNYSEKAIQIDSAGDFKEEEHPKNKKIDNNKRIIPNNKIKEDNMPEKLKDTEVVNTTTVKEDEDIGAIENKESDKINAIFEAVNKIAQAIAPAEPIKNDEGEEAVHGEEELKKEGEQAAVLDKILAKLEEIGASIASKDKKEEDDINDDITKEEIVTDEDIEEEEETKLVADRAYILASKYKEDGAKWTKTRPTDNRYSYMQRFLKLNASLIADKFKSLANTKIDKNNFALAVDAMKSVEYHLEAKAKEKVIKAKGQKILVSDDGKGTRVYDNVF